MTGTGAFSSDISGLSAGSTYHFRLRQWGNGIAYGDDMQFVALPLVLHQWLPLRRPR